MFANPTALRIGAYQSSSWPFLTGTSPKMSGSKWQYLAVTPEPVVIAAKRLGVTSDGRQLMQ
jgi:hypothetical protein